MQNRRLFINPQKQNFINVEAPFSKESSDLAIIKLLDQLAETTVTVKVKFQIKMLQC